MQAAGAAFAVVDAVAGCEEAAGSPVPRGFALIRPPGHHATKDKPMGFCLFSNIALAARYAQQRHGLPKVRLSCYCRAALMVLGTSSLPLHAC